MRQVSCCMETVILEQEHFQSFPEHWQWNVQQTEFGWKTVPHDWSVNGKTAVSVVCLRTWNSELAGLSRAHAPSRVYDGYAKETSYIVWSLFRYALVFLFLSVLAPAGTGEGQVLSEMGKFVNVLYFVWTLPLYHLFTNDCSMIPLTAFWFSCSRRKFIITYLC